MATIFPPQKQQDTPPSAFPDLSTLWMPLHEVRQAWADFCKEALTTSALMATSTAFGGLYWEAHALQHSTWAADERERGRGHQVVFWLSRAVQDLDCALDQWQQVLSWLDLAGNDHRQQAVQDLDCALDQWQQVLSWLDLAGNDHRQQDPETLQMIRSLMAQVQWHQGRRRALHQQLLSEYSTARQHKQGKEHRTGPLAEAREEEV